MRRFLVRRCLIGLLLALVVPTATGHARAFSSAERCTSLTLSPRAVDRVIDGDTFVLFNAGVTNDEKVRVLGVDAWESRDPRGPAATEFTKAWLALGPFTFNACRRDSFGRFLAWINRGVDSLHVALVTNGHGVRVP